MKDPKPTFGQILYAIYALLVFVGVFLVLFPFMFAFVHFKSCRNINHALYRAWGHTVFFLAGIRLKVLRKFKPRKDQVCVFCANHTSYIDIPALYLTVAGDLSFIGKSSLGKVPLFGYVYSRIHILVNRRSVDSRQETVAKSKEAIDNGSHLIMFPEGTIPKTVHAPHMIEFKDGAFKIAIEKQVPIVPVAMPYNYIILPDDNKMKAKMHTCKVVVMEPVETVGLTLNDVESLKKKTYELIKTELALDNPSLGTPA